MKLKSYLSIGTLLAISLNLSACFERPKSHTTEKPSSKIEDNLAITMGVGKLFKFNIEEVMLACNANIGGPTTAAALAISKGWTKLVGPIMVIGTVGYVIGNYVGTIVYFIVTQIGM